MKLQRSSVSTSALFLQGEAQALVHSTAHFSSFSPLFWVITKALPNKYMIQSFYTVSIFTLKSTDAFYFHLMTIHKKCLAIWSWLPRLTSTTPNSPVPVEIHLPSFFNAPHQDSGVFFSSKFIDLDVAFLSHRESYGIWSLRGNVSIMVHTTLPVQRTVLS